MLASGVTRIKRPFTEIVRFATSTAVTSPLKLKLPGDPGGGGINANTGPAVNTAAIAISKSFFMRFSIRTCLKISLSASLLLVISVFLRGAPAELRGYLRGTMRKLNL
jgi:hypothetical protein